MSVAVTAAVKHLMRAGRGLRDRYRSLPCGLENDLTSSNNLQFWQRTNESNSLDVTLTVAEHQDSPVVLTA